MSDVEDNLARDLAEQINIWDVFCVIDDEDTLVDQLIPVIRKHAVAVAAEQPYAGPRP